MELDALEIMTAGLIQKRLTSPAVFGNGRTHTGELCGSGGSRLANYGLGGMLSAVTPDVPPPDEVNNEHFSAGMKARSFVHAKYQSLNNQWLMVVQ